MLSLCAQLDLSLRGRVCFIGLGNIDYGDDGFGVRLAEELVAAGVPDVVIGGISPDRWIAKVADFDHVLFLDAVDCGATAGSIVFLDTVELTARFPQISTHKISLGVLAKWVKMNGTTKAWLLGVQPESLKPSQELTPTMKTTLQLVRELLCSLALADRLEGANA